MTDPKQVEERLRERAEDELHAEFINADQDACGWYRDKAIELRTKLSGAERQRDVSIETENKDCKKALYALAGSNYPTPAEGYGSNSSWAISDLCRAIKALLERAESAEASLKELQARLSPEKLETLAREIADIIFVKPEFRDHFADRVLQLLTSTLGTKSERGVL